MGFSAPHFFLGWENYSKDHLVNYNLETRWILNKNVGVEKLMFSELFGWNVWCAKIQTKFGSDYVKWWLRLCKMIWFLMFFCLKLKGERFKGKKNTVSRRRGRAKRTISKKHDCRRLTIKGKVFFFARRRRKILGYFWGTNWFGYKLNEPELGPPGGLCLQNEFVCTAALMC